MDAFEREQTENLITTYKERSLHRSLKKHFCADEDKHEIKVGRYVADVLDGNTIFEIQTGSFSPLRKKLQFYLENTDFEIVIVRPIAQNRHIIWLDEESGEMKKAPRLSSKHENLASGVADIHYIADFLGNKRISFCFVLMEIDEIRLLNGYGKQKKIRATSVDRVAGEIYSLHYINNKNDIAKALFPCLPDSPFGREELSKSLKLGGLKLWSAQKLLLETDLLKCEKNGNKLIFEKNSKNGNVL